MPKASTEHIECVDLIGLQNRILLLEAEMQRGYEHPAAHGYASIELQALYDDYGSRRRWYLDHDPISLSRYEAHKQTFAELRREGSFQAEQNRRRQMISIRMNLTVSGGISDFDMSLEMEPRSNP